MRLNRLIECPRCDGQHDHQGDFIEKKCKKCGFRLVTVTGPTECPNCEGSGIVECPQFGHALVCEKCGGSGVPKR